MNLTEAETDTLPLNEEEESNFTTQTKKPYTSSINRRIPIAVKLEAVEHAKKTSIKPSIIMVTNLYCCLDIAVTKK